MYTFFSFLLIYGGLGVGVLGVGVLEDWAFGIVVSADGVWGLWCGAF